MPDSIQNPKQTQPQSINRPVILGTMILASMAAVMSTDMYAPSLATLPEALGSTPSMVQLTMGVNALFFGLAQLLHGPLADRFGRRPVMLWGVGLFALFSVMCGLAQNVEQLITARALQGAAASVEAVLLLTIIGDIFEPKDRPKAFAIYGMVWSLAPAIAPIAGAHVHELAGWEMNFYIIAATATLAFVLSFFFLSETGTPDKQALQARRVLSNYLSLLKHGHFLGLALLMSLPLAGVLVYVTSAPFIFQQEFGFSVTQVGYYQAALVLAYMLSSAIVSVIADKVDHAVLIKFSVVCGLSGLLLTTGVLLSSYMSPNTILAGMLLFSIGFGPLFSVTPGMIMDTAANNRGSAAALLGAIEMALVGLAITLLSSFPSDAPQAMAYTFAIISAAWLVVCVFKPWKES